MLSIAVHPISTTSPLPTDFLLVARRVLVLDCGSLLGSILTAMLHEQPGLQVASAALVDLETCPDLLCQMAPEVVVVCRPHDFSVDCFTRVLREAGCPRDTRVVLACLRDNRFEAYQDGRLVSTNFHDLIDWILRI